MQTSLYTPIYVTLLALALAAILAVIIYLYTRKPPLTKVQERPLLVFILICVGLALFAGGMWIGDKITPFIVVEPKSEAQRPFRQLVPVFVYAYFTQWGIFFRPSLSWI